MAKVNGIDLNLNKLTTEDLKACAPAKSGTNNGAQDIEHAPKLNVVTTDIDEEGIVLTGDPEADAQSYAKNQGITLDEAKEKLANLFGAPVQNGQQPQNPNMGQQPFPQGQIGQQPLNPNIGQQAQNPNPGQQPQNPNIGQQPQNPNIGQQPQDPNMGQQPQNPNPGQQPQNPNPGQQPQDPNPGQQPQNPNPGQQSTPQAQISVISKNVRQVINNVRQIIRVLR